VPRREHQETRRKGTNVCNHCGHNDHQRKSSALCPFNVPAGKVPDHTGMRMINDDQLPTTVDIVPANTQENVTCASSVASLGLQDRANQPNQLSAIVRRKIESQDSYSDDDVSAISDSDSDVLLTVEKADIVEFLDDDSSTLAGFEEELST